MMAKWLLLLAYMSLAVKSIDVQKKTGRDLNDGVNVEVEWIIQTRLFTFTGFLVEFLGYMRGFSARLPQLRVSQSFFRESLEESPLDEQLLRGLFREEAMHLVSIILCSRLLCWPF